MHSEASSMWRRWWRGSYDDAAVRRCFTNVQFPSVDLISLDHHLRVQKQQQQKKEQQNVPSWWTPEDVAENSEPFTDALYDDTPNVASSSPNDRQRRRRRSGNNDGRNAKPARPKTWDDIRREAQMRPRASQ